MRVSSYEQKRFKPKPKVNKKIDNSQTIIQNQLNKRGEGRKLTKP